MKYMTFNNSCFFTALANLLEDYGIEISDRDLLLKGEINFVFRYNQEKDYYYSGYQVQEDIWINNCLNKFGLQFSQIKYESNDIMINKQKLISFLKTSNKKCIVSLKVLNSNEKWHATIFQGVEDNYFNFLNMKRLNSQEPDLFILNENELSHKLADVVRCGWIEKNNGSSLNNLNIEDEKQKSIDVLNRYKNDVVYFCSQISSENERVIKRDTLFRALLLSYYSVVEIMENKELIKELSIVRDEYLKTFHLHDDIRLNEYLNLTNFSNLVNKVKDSILK